MHLQTLQNTTISQQNDPSEKNMSFLYEPTFNRPGSKKLKRKNSKTELKRFNSQAYKKGLQWDKQRQTKMIAMRIEAENAKLEECSFQPMKISMKPKRRMGTKSSEYIPKYMKYNG